jgi:hypothetical protein
MDGWEKVTPVSREFFALQVEQNVEKGDYILICPDVDGSRQRVVSASAFAENFIKEGDLQDSVSAVEPEEAEYLNEYGAGKLLSFTTDKMQKMRARGTGPRFSKVGRLVRYSRQDIVDYMASSQIVVNPKAKTRNAHGESIVTFRRALRVLHNLKVGAGSPDFPGITARALVDSGLVNTVLRDAKFPINAACNILKTMVDRGFAKRYRKSVRDYFHYSPTE